MKLCKYHELQNIEQEDRNLNLGGFILLISLAYSSSIFSKLAVQYGMKQTQILKTFDKSLLLNTNPESK